MRVIVFVMSMAVLTVVGNPGMTQRRSASPTVTVEAAVPVSETGFAFVEPFVAADPTNARNLVISASQVDPKHGITGRAFVSTDGGTQWHSPDLPGIRTAIEAGRFQGFEDMWVTFGGHDTAYLSALAIHSLGPQRLTDAWGAMPVFVYRSVNGGETWSGPTVIRTRSADAPKLAVRNNLAVIAVQVNAGDTLVGVPRAGNEYIALFRSADGARSFQAPVLLSPDDLGRNPVNPVFLPDGSLVIGWFDHPHYGRSGPEQQVVSSRIFVTRSTDGARTFEALHVVTDVQRSGFPAVLRMVVDTGRQSPRRGRIYMLWNGGDATRSDVSVAHSDDGGQHWSVSRRASSAQSGSAVFTAAAVDGRGILGLAWAQHEGDPERTPCYQVLFSASLDGGETFVAPQQLTSGAVCPDNPANRAIAYPAYGRVDTVSISWRHGGDYIGLAADAENVFHPVWTDTRDGPYRVYTARVRVGTP